jgi:putative ABC transport system substrate-binding protein
MRRRHILSGLAATAGTGMGVRHAAGQVAPKALRVGVASLANRRGAPPFDAFESRLAELGHVEGRNFTFDFVALEGRVDAMGEAMRALVARKADVLVAFGPEVALKAAMAATTQVPIVMVAIDYDPVALGHVASLARPGGNVTGLFLQQIELAVKRVQFLREAFPDLQAATVFWDGPSAPQWRAISDQAPALGLTLVGVELVGQPYDYDAALARTPVAHRRVLVVGNSPRFFADRVRLAEFALRRGVATMFAWREWVDLGGLLSYGPSFTQVARRAAEYVDRVARGVKPSDLPIEQPTRFELVVNLRTAKALGLVIPPTILARADEVIE